MPIFHVGRPLFGFEGHSNKHFLEWSPDGTHIIFNKDIGFRSDYSDSTIWVVDAEGTLLRTIVDTNPVSLDWAPTLMLYGIHASVSPDGSRIVYSTCEYESQGLGSRWYPDYWQGRDKYHYEIATIAIEGGAPERLTENVYLDHHPVWSPDGTRIAFIANPQNLYFNRGQLFTMSPDGSNVSEVMGTAHDRVSFYPPVWSPDGQRLAFIVNKGQFNPFKRILYTVRLDGSELKEIGETTTMPTWSPDSGRVAFAMSDEEGAAIYAARPDGTDLHQVWSSGPGETHPPITQVLWSPDGSEILVVSGRLWAIRPDGSGLSRIGVFKSSHLGGPCRVVVRWVQDCCPWLGAHLSNLCTLVCYFNGPRRDGRAGPGESGG